MSKRHQNRWDWCGPQRPRREDTGPVYFGCVRENPAGSKATSPWTERKARPTRRPGKLKERSSAAPGIETLEGRIIGPRQTHANGPSSGSGGDDGRARCEQGLTGSDVPGGGRHCRPEPEERGGASARVRQGPSGLRGGVTITENYQFSFLLLLGFDVLASPLP